MTLEASTVLPASDAAGWDAALSAVAPEKADVYFSAGYHAAFREPGLAEPVLFSYSEGKQRFLYPLLVRPIDRVGDAPVAGGLFDAESVYGFTGPVATTQEPAFVEAAWAAFSAWARQRRIVAEFVRFNPILGNQAIAPAGMTVEAVREHVVLDVSPGDEAVFAGYSKKNRNMIRRAERSGIVCRVAPLSKWIDAFCGLYAQTMDRNKAAAHYYFPRRSFETLAAHPWSLACAATIGERVVAVSLFLLGPRRLHYHLSGASEEGLRLAANNLILHSMAGEARRRGLLLFHLGGGRTGASDDALLRFKAGFSPARLPVCVGRRVHDEDAYASLCATRRTQTSVPPGYFLGYRYEPASGPR